MSYIGRLSYLGKTTGPEFFADTDQLVDGAVTQAKMASNSVGTDELIEDSVDKTTIAADVAGSGLGQAAGGELDVQVDGTTVEVDSNTGDIQVVIGGIGPDQLDFGSITLDSFANAAGDVNLGGNNITNVTDPDSPQDAATKNYVDTFTQPLGEGVEYYSDFFPSITFDREQQVTFAHGVGSVPQFVFGYGTVYTEGANESGEAGVGKSTRPTMGANFVDFALAYTNYDSTNVTVSGSYRVNRFHNLGGTRVDNHYGDAEFSAITQPPDYDSGWFAVSSNTTYTKTHGLGQIPDFVLVEISDNNSVASRNWVVPVMSATSGKWATTSLVYLDDSDVKIRTRFYMCDFQLPTSQGGRTRPTSGYARILAYSTWNTSERYDSGWIESDSDDATKRLHFFDHGLNKMPSAVMLYVAEGDDSGAAAPGTGTARGWVSASLSSLNDERAATIQTVNKKWIVVTHRNLLAHIVDESGNVQSPTSGYIRVLAWP